jgi:hypothetical protein
MKRYLLIAILVVSLSKLSAQSQIDRSWFKTDEEIDRSWGQYEGGRGSASQHRSLKAIKSRLSEQGDNSSQQLMPYLGESLRKIAMPSIYQVKERIEVYDIVQSALLRIPGHAQFFADQLAEARRISEKPWLDSEYQRIYLQIRDTMIHLPSPETIKVLGGMLESQEDLLTTDDRLAIWREQNEMGFQGGIVPSPLSFADTVFKGIGLRESSGYPPNGTRDTVLDWWSRVKSGEVAISFEGQAEEYRFRPDGTWDTIPIANPTGALVTPPQAVRRERAEKRRPQAELPPHAPEDDPSRSVMMAAVSLLMIGTLAWWWKVRRIQRDTSVPQEGSQR